jgi:hypothetical protein
MNYKINEKLGSSNYDKTKMDLKLVPLDEVSKSSTEFYLVDTDNFEQVPTTVNIAWDGKYGSNQEIPFEFTFFDENRELIKDVKYAYVVLDEFDNEIARNDGGDSLGPGITSIEGLDIQRIFVPSAGQIRVDILVYGTGLDYDPTYAGIGSAIIEIGPGSTTTTPSVPEKTPIPSWIKNNAEWWAAGQIDDGSFVQGIQYLIKEDVLKIPPTSQGTSSGSNDIPAWIKNNAEWWAAGQIDDDSFIQGIQYLIKEGIMRIQS